MARLFRKEEEKKTLWTRIKDVALTDVGVLVRGLDQEALERLEELLIAADFGAGAALRIVDKVESLVRGGAISTGAELHRAVEDEIASILEAGNADTSLHLDAEPGPAVVLTVGVNGVGKTTTIAKLAHRLQGRGRRALLAAADTFRAGAVDQLAVWADRVGAEFVSAETGADPASVAFDAIDAARGRGADTVIVDTAGRLHTQRDLMAELAKIERVIGKRVEGGPHETLLVLDATVGQNAVRQLRLFGDALELTGLVLAKLDSTAKGGVVVALKNELDVPVKLVGTGESLDDLEPFDARTFAREVLDV